MPLDKNSALIRLSSSPLVSLGRLPFKDQTPAQQVFTAIWELESEVNNGGFHQYFLNSSGDSASGVVKALDRIGALKLKPIVIEALAIFPRGAPPDDWDERQRVLADADDAVLARWEQLDQEFYKYPDNLTELLFTFVQCHEDEFGRDWYAV